VLRSTFLCGPLEVDVAAEDRLLLDAVGATLALFDVRWGEPPRRVALDIARTAAPVRPAAGTWLVCDRMLVDRTEAGPYATCGSGASCRATGNDAWSIAARAGAPLDHVEDLVLLVLTASWRAAGWIPIHAGAVARDGRCAIVCAPSNGGKTTMTAALVSRSWQTLGDDKLLLRIGEDRRPELGALQHTFNLDPRTRDWLPEVGDLASRPRYSAWTEKRRVRIEEIWPGRAIRAANPSHLVHLRRSGSRGGARVEPMGGGEVLDVLLRQTVVPCDRDAAARILGAISSTARRLIGVRVEVGEGMFRDPDSLVELERALR
jgi:hypothetical protein